MNWKEAFYFFQFWKYEKVSFSCSGWNILPTEVKGSFVINFKRIGMSPLILAASKTEGSFLLTAYDLLTESEIH